jgi:membrane-bound lytic murein transglycosylase A
MDGSINCTRQPLFSRALFLLLFLALSACSRQPFLALEEEQFPALVENTDDRASLLHAIEQSLFYLQDKPQNSTFTINEQTYPISRLTVSLEFFRQLLTDVSSRVTLHYLLKQHFDLYQADGVGGYNPEHRMLVTGYYQPVFSGSLARDDLYRYPVYSVPGDLVVQYAIDSGQPAIGRFQQNRFTAYWSRKEIEENNRLAGYELVYLKDPLDAYFLHIQGSGIIELPDGSQRAIAFAMRNGHPYRSIGKYLVKKNKLSPQEVNLESIRAYIDQHPEERDEILHHNPSFIFFRWSETMEAVGNLGIPLTPLRSVAADQSIFPAGGLALLGTRMPVVIGDQIHRWKPYYRFILIQDSGSAIKGPGRVDIFWGRGDRAGLAAGHMKESGKLYLLLLKDDHPALHRQQHEDSI